MWNINPAEFINRQLGEVRIAFRTTVKACLLGETGVNLEFDGGQRLLKF